MEKYNDLGKTISHVIVLSHYSVYYADAAHLTIAVKCAIMILSNCKVILLNAVSLS